MRNTNLFGRMPLLGSLAILIMLLGSCDSHKKDIFKFNPDFERPWIGPDFWANPLQDWRINDGRIECFVSGGDRNLFLLTREIEESNTGFETEVKFGALNQNISSEEGWIGFKVGISGDFNDYRDNAVRGEGMPVGIDTKGRLFIGKIGNNEPVIANWEEMSLELEVIPDGDKMLAKLVVENADGDEIGSYEKAVHPDWFVGGIALACSAGPVPEIPDERPAVMNSNWGFKAGTERKGNVTAWFSDWEVSGDQVGFYPDRAFGPILWAQYTLSDNIVRLSAQMAPVGKDDDQLVYLDIKDDENWKEMGTADIDPLSRTATFEITEWDGSSDVPYRLRYTCFTHGTGKKNIEYEGMIRKEPWDKDELKVAGFTGNNDLGFPNNDIFNSVVRQEPDFLFFSGDQIYEGVAGFGTQTSPLEAACLDYLRKWYLYGWAYGEILKDRPSVAIPDDHDVYHGNLWGAGGIATPEGLTGYAAQDKGGYKYDPVWVNMVQRTQTSHLPACPDPDPVAQDIGVYFTNINYAGVSFAVIEDRKFKSAPAVMCPQADVINGWSKNPDWDAAMSGDVDGAILLGQRQLDFLEDWAADWSGSVWMKVVLSQTIFANVATLPEKDANTDASVPRLRIMNAGEYPPDDVRVQDHDSNGWPQSARNNALKKLRKAYAFHIAGDQHLGSVIEYGIDDYNDAGFAFCVPAISNIWPRRWFPREGLADHTPEKPGYRGEFLDGFGNHITVHAISNPVFTGRIPQHLYDRATGFGITRFERESRDIVMECYQRVHEDGKDQQYPDWPIRINQYDNYLADSEYALPKLNIPDIEDAIVQVVDESDGSIVFTIRIKGNEFKPVVEKPGMYAIRISKDGYKWKEMHGLEAKSPGEAWGYTLDTSR